MAKIDHEVVLCERKETKSNVTSCLEKRYLILGQSIFFNRFIQAYKLDNDRIIICFYLKFNETTLMYVCNIQSKSKD